MRAIVLVSLATIMAIMAIVAIGRAEAAPRSNRSSNVHVTLTAAIDESERAAHVDAIRRSLTTHARLANLNVDITVNRLAVNVVGADVEIVAEVSFVLSTRGDQIVSMGNQTSKLRIARRHVTPTKLPMLRKEVIEDGLRDLRRKLRAVAARTV